MKIEILLACAVLLSGCAQPEYGWRYEHGVKRYVPTPTEVQAQNERDRMQDRTQRVDHTSDQRAVARLRTGVKAVPCNYSEDTQLVCDLQDAGIDASVSRTHY